MRENSHGKQLDEVNAAITRSREELIALAEGMTKLAADGERHDTAWSSVRHGLDVAGSRGRKAAVGLAHEIERHPIIGGLVAFGVGFGIATIIFRRSGRESNG